MKITLATSLLGLAMLSACTTAPHMTTARTQSDFKATKSSRYASNNTWGNEPAAPAEGQTADIPAEGPADVSRNPALVPSPLLRTNAIGSP
jgi:hypothetical protein